MTRHTMIIVLAAILFSWNCSSEEQQNPPKFRVRNDRPTKASLQVKTTGGNTININDVQPGQTTEYRESSVGGVDITVSIQGETITPTGSFDAKTNGSYTIVVANTTPPTVAVIMP